MKKQTVKIFEPVAMKMLLIHFDYSKTILFQINFQFSPGSNVPILISKMKCSVMQKFPHFFHHGLCSSVVRRFLPCHTYYWQFCRSSVLLYHLQSGSYAQYVVRSGWVSISELPIEGAFIDSSKLFKENIDKEIWTFPSSRSDRACSLSRFIIGTTIFPLSAYVST